MNQWVFVIAAYAAVWTGTAGLAALSWLRMRRAEAAVSPASHRRSS